MSTLSDAPTETVTKFLNVYNLDFSRATKSQKIKDSGNK
jgi:hypothetical protein